MIGVSLDVTARHELEDRLRQAQKMEAVGRLAGGVAHDFNNLLQVIQGHARFALEALPEPGDLREDLEAVYAASERAARLTRQLLAFSRKQILQPRELDLNAVVRGVMPMLGRLIGEDIAVVTHLAPRLGAVTADPAQLEQVLVNLAVNARDAMPEGGTLGIETADVALDAAACERRDGPVAPGAYVRLAVRDTGAGMDEATRARAFEPFFTTKAPGKGTGLGLATVYGIVRQSGGCVTVSSAPGAGTTVVVELPRTSAPEPARPAADAPAPGRGTGTVLLVEDDATVRQFVRRVLEWQGYAVLEAAHGPDALRVAAEHGGRIDLVLTDVVMPGMSGRALAEALTASRPGLRVLFMSGYTDDEILRRGLGTTGVALLEKPFTAEALRDAVRRELDAART
jgi:nitrogen-specific signal transduction histidine kinase/ActR/RegA family two-component response regulator